MPFCSVVGVGSVGTRCYVALFLADEDDPLFLQVKEAGRSVLESSSGKSRWSLALRLSEVRCVSCAKSIFYKRMLLLAAAMA